MHGGFWKAEYGRKLMHPLCHDLAERGWAAWNLEYRRIGRLSGGGYPNTLRDVFMGVAHLDALPDADRLDRSRVVAVGHSAGGHLAAWAASRTLISELVLQAAVLDVELAWERRLSDGVVARFLGGTPEEVPERYADAQPMVPLGARTLLVHGGRDAVVPLEFSERFLERARAAGDDVTLVVESEEEHMGHVDPSNPLWARVLEWL